MTQEQGKRANLRRVTAYPGLRIAALFLGASTGGIVVFRATEAVQRRDLVNNYVDKQPLVRCLQVANRKRPKQKRWNSHPATQ